MNHTNPQEETASSIRAWCSWAIQISFGFHDKLPISLVLAPWNSEQIYPTQGIHGILSNDPVPYFVIEPPLPLNYRRYYVPIETSRSVAISEIWCILEQRGEIWCVDVFEMR